MNVENLQKLYEVGRKILTDRRPFGFGSWTPVLVNASRPECGTFCCFAGYYVIETDRKYLDYDYGTLARHFGISREQAHRLFRSCYADDDLNGDEPGPEAYAELERRMAYLANLIREAGGTVPSNYTGLPDSIREIFDVPALALRQAG